MLISLRWTRFVTAVLLLFALAGCGGDTPQTKAEEKNSECSNLGAGADNWTVNGVATMEGAGGKVPGAGNYCTPDLYGELEFGPDSTFAFYDNYVGPTSTNGGYSAGAYSGGTGTFGDGVIYIEQYFGDYSAAIYCHWETGSVEITQNAAAIGQPIIGNFSTSGSATPEGGATCPGSLVGTFRVSREL